MSSTELDESKTFHRFETGSVRDGDTSTPRHTASRPEAEWKVKHLVHSVRGGCSPEQCAGCPEAPPESGWYRVVFHCGGWGAGDERREVFCSEACVDAWLDRESDVTLR